MHDLSARNPSSESSSVGTARALAVAAVCVQVPVLIVLLFGDFGWMFPGRFGLQFQDFFYFLAFYAIALPVGLIASVVGRSWLLFLTQPAILACAWIVLSILAMPPPAVDAADFQHLIGQDRSKMKSEIGETYMTSGWTKSPEGQFDFYGYNGLTVYVDQTTGIIDHITPNWRSKRP